MPVVIYILSQVSTTVCIRHKIIYYIILYYNHNNSTKHNLIETRSDIGMCIQQ